MPTRDQLARVDQLLDELFDLPAEDRIPALRRRSEDPEVQAEVESLLHAAQASTGFLSAPVRPSGVAAPDAFVGMRIGVWRTTRLLGRGGMGEVFEAVRDDGSFDQTVAIKLLQQDAAAQLERFQVERQILARLEHSGIARLYDGGVSPDGRPYMVMEFVAGTSITEYCARHAPSLAERLRLFVQVCDAVAFAHRNLIVHRDLKPSNILVTEGGKVKLLDFGIAKLLDEQRARVTQAAAAPMTPICAAPEQLTGGAITTATDIYALGLLLFELLTGTHPFMGMGAPMLQAMRTVLQKPAPHPSVVAAERPDAPIPARVIRGDLDAIVGKALRLEPAKRYATVEAMQLDVERSQRGEPVEAREGARLYSVGRVVRRYRWAAMAVAAIIISLSVGLGIAAWQAQKAAVERDAARRDAAREEAVRFSLTRMFHAAIADQSGKATTAKGMIDSSAQRVLREYRDQPQLAGEIVLTLADLYAALEDVNGAAALLEGFINEADPRVDPVALADARQKLAVMELQQGHTEQAAKLLDQAEAFWRSKPNAYAEERLEGLVVRVRLQRAQGDFTAAIESTRDAIVQRVALSGRNHRETAVLYNTLAIALASASRMPEATQAYHEAMAIYAALGLGDSIDAQVIAANTGTIEMRAGHLREAEVLLKSSTERERSLAGDSAAVAAAMSYYGRLLSETNRNAAAVGVLREASDMAAHYAGVDSPVAVQARVFLGEALLANGTRPEADTILRKTHDDALAHFPAAHPLTLRTTIGLGELAIADKDFAKAQGLLGDCTANLRKLGPPAASNLAFALTLLGDVEMQQGDVQGATSHFHEAVQIREKAPDDVWELAVAQERMGEALQKSGSDAALPLLKKAAAALEAQLGAAHPETLRARAALKPLAT
jgi:hypothetical protein